MDGVNITDGTLILTGDGRYSNIYSLKGLDNIHFLNRNGEEIPCGGKYYTSFLDLVGVVRYCINQGWYDTP